MGLYDRHVLPRLIDFTCSLETHMRQREKIVPKASGSVLEIGFGSGLNVQFYDRAKVERVWALEPSANMWKRAEGRARSAPVPIEPLTALAERVPLPDDSVDTVLVTYTLCTISDVPSALAEAKRVLKKDGRFLFCEHGAAPDKNVLRWQNRLNPVWKRLGGGCNLNRPIPQLIEDAGFRIGDLSTMYLPGWRPGSFNYWGMAMAES